MQVITTSLHDVKLIRLGRFEDKRGYFCEIYNARTLADRGISETFVQDNESYSRNKGTIRGLHFQLRPFAQAKLVRVLRGSILDVVVDLRTDSPGFGRHIAIPLTPHALEQIYIPPGFAHGFCTLEPDTVVSYKVSAPTRPNTTAALPGTIRIWQSIGRCGRQTPSCRTRTGSSRGCGISPRTSPVRPPEAS